MLQMAANEDLLQKMVQEQVDAAAASATGNIMEQMFGEDMGVLAAALEMLETEDAGDAEELTFDLELEERLYTTLEEAMARLEAMPEPEPVPYRKNDAKWERFGILLSGIISTLNDHDLHGMDVEEHVPVMEQKIVSLVRRSWGGQWPQRSAGYDPLFGAGGLHPAVSALQRGVFAGGTDGGNHGRG